MKREYVDGFEFYKIFISGAKSVIRNKIHLNNINVFPVPDGDTGSNMEATLNSLINFTNVSFSFEETSKSMANATMLGARGNSGIIFAQYIKGIAEAANGYQTIHFKEFIDLNFYAAQKLINAISKPVEGTIITVIRSWAEYLKTNKNSISSFEELFLNSIDTAENSLSKTTEQLEVLKKYNVVDSGAKGFVYFLEGIRRYILDDDISEELNLFSDNINLNIIEIDNLDENLEYRYCCECVILNSNYQKKELMESISTFGENLICIENDNKIKVHMHTNTPYKLFEKLYEFGTISIPKIDDMLIQSNMIKDKSDIAIVTDSIADIPQEILDKYNVYTINLNIQIGESQFVDKIGISREMVYNYMNSETYPTSSAVNKMQIEIILKRILQNYKNIIVITVSSKLSGMYNLLSNVVENLNYDGNIEIIDSKLNSVAQGLLVYKAIELLSQGKDFETIIEQIKLNISKLEIYVALNTIKNVMKSGRVDKRLVKLASNAHIKLSISLDREGNGTVFGWGTSYGRIVQKILNIAKTKKINNEVLQYAISYSGKCKKAVIFAEKLEMLIGFPPLFITEISSVTALHVGEDAVAVSFLE